MQVSCDACCNSCNNQRTWFINLVVQSSWPFSLRSVKVQMCKHVIFKLCKHQKCDKNQLKFADPLSLAEGRGLGTRLGLTCESDFLWLASIYLWGSKWFGSITQSVIQRNVVIKHYKPRHGLLVLPPVLEGFSDFPGKNCVEWEQAKSTGLPRHGKSSIEGQNVQHCSVHYQLIQQPWLSKNKALLMGYHVGRPGQSITCA